jgi:Glycosyl hydrolases family 28
VWSAERDIDLPKSFIADYQSHIYSSASPGNSFLQPGPKHMPEYVNWSRSGRAQTRPADRPLIDRRAFLKTSIYAAGAAFGCSLTSCDSGELSIPCLGSAPPPTPVPGMTYIRASEIGCALDCDLRNGRNKYAAGPATDDGPRINAAMASATADNPITLIIDGSALISGLFLPTDGGWNIAGLGCGTGFFIKTGANNDGVHNGRSNAAVPFDPGPPAPARGADVSLKNLTINGNQGNGHSGNSTSGDRRGINGQAWYCGINLMNLNNITVENVVVVNVPTYHMRFSNVGNVRVFGCVMKSYGIFNDGIHINGPANDITISNCDFATGDDSIALNCPEGYTGNISRVTVDNCTFDSWSFMRLYTCNWNTNKFNIDSVTVSNCSGNASEAAFIIGLGGQSNPNSVDHLSISDCQLTAPAALGIAENFGSIALKNVTLTPWQSRIVWVPPQPNFMSAFLRPSPASGNIRYVGSNLSFENCQILHHLKDEIAAVTLENDSTIANLIFNGFGLLEAGPATPVPSLVHIGWGSIGQLVLNSVNGRGITAPLPADEFPHVGSVSGRGVLASGWQFPDTVMADGVPYISASTGAPSIKVNGVINPYTG